MTVSNFRIDQIAYPLPKVSEKIRISYLMNTLTEDEYMRL